MCSSLTSITIPASVTSIGVSAFYSCDSLTSITIPASVTSIGDFAFYNCTRLADVTFENVYVWSVSLLTVDDIEISEEILAEDLSDTATAASYLTDVYDNYYWTREQ